MSIILTKIKKQFDNQLAVNNVSLHINDSEFFVFLGSSGSGKSTLLRIIAGLISPDSGKVEINSRDVTKFSPQQRNTGFVFQNYSVFRHMTVRENIEFGLKIRKVPINERKKQSAELLELVGLTGLDSRYADQLSGGQQQRVALARALAYKPSVLLLDEPFGALDVKIRSQLRRSLKEIQSKIQLTTVFVTHDQQEAFELSDRIAIINQGQIIEVDTPENLYCSPKSEFTATFVGAGNVLVGRKEKNSIRLGSTFLPFPEKSELYDENEPVRILFRPESIILNPDEYALDKDLYGLGVGKITDIKFNGSFRRVLLEVESLRGVQPLEPHLPYGQSSIRIEAVQSTSAIKEKYCIGQELWIGLKKFHILEPAGLKILIYTDQSFKNTSSAGFPLGLAHQTGGSVNLLSVVNSPDQLSDTLIKLQDIREKWISSLNEITANVRMGNFTDEILYEAQEGKYEIVVFGWNDRNLNYIRSAMQLLISLKIPVLLTNNEMIEIKKILICTKAGEPGKDDIRFGGRIAKLTKSSATLFHVLRKNSFMHDKIRAEKHLQSGKATLAALDVPGEIIIEEENSPIKGILNEFRRNNYDLLIIGAAAPKNPHSLFWNDLTNQIINITPAPVLIIPMAER